MNHKEKMIAELDFALEQYGINRMINENHDNAYIENIHSKEYVIHGLNPDNYFAVFQFASANQIDTKLGESISIYCRECESDELDNEVITEAVNKTFIIRDKIYPIIEKSIGTPQGDRKFRNLVQKFIDKHSNKLYAVGPTELIPFTDFEKDEFFEVFGTTKETIVKIIVEMTRIVNDKASWRLLRQNPIFCLFYETIRYYTLKKNDSGVNVALCIYALSAYPSVFSAIFPYGANVGVMTYTVDKMSDKFLIKQQKNVFNMLMTSIQNSYKFLKESIIESSDVELIRFVARIRNDQKSLLKNIANIYYSNHKKNLRISTQSETYGDDNQLIDDKLNNTSVVEDVTRKTVLSIIMNGVDITRATAAAKTAGISVSDLRFYLSKIVIEDNAESIRAFIEAILFIYLYDEHHTTNEINEQKFLAFALNLFRRTNSGNDNVITIKNTLNKWSADSGISKTFRREATQINYKRGIYNYMILCIQYYNS